MYNLPLEKEKEDFCNKIPGTPNKRTDDPGSQHKTAQQGANGDLILEKEVVSTLLKRDFTPSYSSTKSPGRYIRCSVIFSEEK